MGCYRRSHAGKLDGVEILADEGHGCKISGGFPVKVPKSTSFGVNKRRFSVYAIKYCSFHSFSS